MDRTKFLALFASESKEHLDSLFSLGLRLEKAPEPEREKLLDEMFRHAHSLKGASGMMGFDDVMATAHRLESCMGTLKRFPDDRLKTALTPRLTDLFLTSAKRLQEIVSAALEGKPAAALPPDESLKRLEDYLESVQPPRAAVAPTPEMTPAPPLGFGVHLASSPLSMVPTNVVSGKPVYLVRLTVDPQSRMPAMRAFLAYKKLGVLGPVLSCVPSVDDLRNGILPDLSLEMTTQAEEASIKATMNALSEVKSWEVVPFSVASQAPSAADDPGAAPDPAGEGAAAPEGTGQKAEGGPAPSPSPASTSPSASSEQAAPAGVPSAEAGGASASASVRPPSPTLRVKTELLDTLLDTVGDFIFSLTRLREMAESAVHGSPEAIRRPFLEGMNSLHREARTLHGQVINARMTALSTLTDRLQLAIRKLAWEQNKAVDVTITGAETEVDHTVLDVLGDPLIHLVRNAVDHGLEPAIQRLAAGKPETGRVTIAARRAQSSVILEISDDGRGLDVAKLKASALKKGLITPARSVAMTDQEAWRLCFHPGLSTSNTVTSVSGRGVGMDVVKNAIDRVGGTIAIDSKPGVGTTWTLSLPYTVAIAQVLMVKVAGERIGLPISRILHVASAKAEDFGWMDEPGVGLQPDGTGRTPAFTFAGATIPLFSLERLIFSPSDKDGDRHIAAPGGNGLMDDFADAAGRPAIVYELESGRRIALLADDLCGLQRSILRPIRPPLDRLAGLMGVTLQTNGLPAFIVDPGRMVGDA